MITITKNGDSRTFREVRKRDLFSGKTLKFRVTGLGRDSKLLKEVKNREILTVTSTELTFSNIPKGLSFKIVKKAPGKLTLAYQKPEMSIQVSSPLVNKLVELFDGEVTYRFFNGRLSISNPKKKGISASFALGMSKK